MGWRSCRCCDQKQRQRQMTASGAESSGHHCGAAVAAALPRVGRTRAGETPAPQFRTAVPDSCNQQPPLWCERLRFLISLSVVSSRDDVAAPQSGEPLIACAEHCHLPLPLALSTAAVSGRCRGSCPRSPIGPAPPRASWVGGKFEIRNSKSTWTPHGYPDEPNVPTLGWPGGLVSGRLDGCSLLPVPCPGRSAGSRISCPWGGRQRSNVRTTERLGGPYRRFQMYSVTTSLA